MQLCGLQPTGLLCPWDSPGKNTKSGFPCPSPGDLPDPGVKPVSLMSPALAGGFLIAGATWEVLLFIPELLFPSLPAGGIMRHLAYLLITH